MSVTVAFSFFRSIASSSQSSTSTFALLGPSVSKAVAFSVLCAGTLGSFAACSGTTRTTFEDDTKDATTVDPVADSGPKPPAFTDATLTDTGAPKGPAEVFGHSGSVLYRLDPDTKAATVVGPFSGCNEPRESVIDIALDEASNMYGTTRTGLFRIDKATAKCTKVADAGAGKSFPNSLSFVPKGTLDPAAEALVGYVDDVYVRIDPMTGAITNIGKLDAIRPSKVRSSGDIVSVIGGPTYLTVTSVGNDTQCSTADCLVEIDPKTGALLKNLGLLNSRQEVFGVAFWAGAIYGFTNSGSLFQVQISGGALALTEITIPQAPAGLSFYGAGSTTSAPIQPK